MFTKGPPESICQSMRSHWSLIRSTTKQELELHETSLINYNAGRTRQTRRVITTVQIVKEERADVKAVTLIASKPLGLLPYHGSCVVRLKNQLFETLGQYGINSRRVRRNRVLSHRQRRQSVMSLLQTMSGDKSSDDSRSCHTGKKNNRHINQHAGSKPSNTLEKPSRDHIERIPGTFPDMHG